MYRKIAVKVKKRSFGGIMGTIKCKKLSPDMIVTTFGLFAIDVKILKQFSKLSFE